MRKSGKNAEKKGEKERKTGSYSNVLVMLCHGLRKDGHPSPLLLSRIEKTTELYREGSYDKVIITGGILKYDVSEADVAAVFMHNIIPKEALILERNSMITLHNALFVWDILKDEKVRRMTVVTSDFHIPRTKHIFSRIFEHTKIDLRFVAAKSKINTFTRLDYFMKEHYALMKLRLRGIE